MSPVRATIAVVGAAMTAAFVWADRILLHPSRGRLAIPGVENRVIDFEGRALEVSIARAGSAVETFVLMFTGNAERAEVASWIALDQFRGTPTEIWSVNYPGFGESGGSASIRSLARVGLAAYDALAEVAGPRKIVVCGTSIGATVALHVARHRRTDAMLLITPPPLASLILGYYAWWNLWLLALPVAARVPAELDAIENAKHVNVPAVFVITLDDGIVPTSYQRRVVEAYAGPRQIVETPGGHNDWTHASKIARQRAAILELLDEL